MNLSTLAIRRCGLVFALLAVLFISLTTFTACEQPQAEKNHVVAFVNVNVIPMDREVILENQTVMVRDGQITDVEPSDQITIPAG